MPRWLIWLLVLLPFLFGTCIELLGLPWAIRYLLDAVWILLLLCMTRIRRQSKTPTKWLAFWIGAFLLYTLVNYGANYQSGLYYLWGVRNNFRAYVVFFAGAAVLTSEDVEDMFRIFEKLFWINAVVTVVQYFALGLSGDFLGGLFGAQSGVNGYTNIFCAVIVARSLVLYLEKKESTAKCFAKCGTALLVAVLTELKFFFVEVLVIIAMAVLLTNFTWRKFWVVLGGILAVFVGAFTISILFPDFAGWFSVEWLISEATSEKGYTYDGDMNRLRSIPIINELWLRNSSQRLFGLGLGNCDTASVAALDTHFYKLYGQMHYGWFSYAHMYLECGWIGLVFYAGFFVLLYLYINKLRKRTTGMKQSYCRIALILTVVSMMLLVYNSSLRTEAAYIMFFALSIPFVRDEGHRNKKTEGGGGENGRIPAENLSAG